MAQKKTVRMLTKKDLMRLKGGSTIVCNNYRTQTSLCDGRECKTRCAPMDSVTGGTSGATTGTSAAGATAGAGAAGKGKSGKVEKTEKVIGSAGAKKKGDASATSTDSGAPKTAN